MCSAVEADIHGPVHRSQLVGAWSRPQAGAGRQHGDGDRDQNGHVQQYGVVDRPAHGAGHCGADGEASGHHSSGVPIAADDVGVDQVLDVEPARPIAQDVEHRVGDSHVRTGIVGGHLDLLPGFRYAYCTGIPRFPKDLNLRYGR